jgi:phenylalanyl-tRNA synthetase beta chain
VVNYLAYYLGTSAELRPAERPTFLPGRSAEVLIAGVSAGWLGEVHPEVLESWGVRMPAAYLEIRVAGLSGPGTVVG